MLKIIGLFARGTTVRKTLEAILFISVLVLVLAPLQKLVNPTTVGFALLLGVLFTAIRMGSKPALAASVVAMLGYNFFFLPPILTLTIYDPQNWVALAAFSVTAFVTGQLSAKSQQRANEAEASRREVERLYLELQGAFEKASNAEAIKRSELMKSALLDAVTHDLRTPLTSIRAAATTLHKAQRAGQTLDSDLAKELVELVDSESLHLDQIISSFVELARIEGGDLTLTTTWSSFHDVAQAAIKRTQMLMTKHHVAVEIPEDLPMMHIDVRALADLRAEAKLRQDVLGLIEPPHRNQSLHILRPDVRLGIAGRPESARHEPSPQLLEPGVSRLWSPGRQLHGS